MGYCSNHIFLKWDVDIFPPASQVLMEEYFKVTLLSSANARQADSLKKKECYMN